MDRMSTGEMRQIGEELRQTAQRGELRQTAQRGEETETGPAGGCLTGHIEGGVKAHV